MIKGELMLGIGLDFGTTNSTVAIFDGINISYIEIDEYSDNNVVMPTANYMDRNFVATIGTQAITNYIIQNQGRTIKLTKEELGSISVTYGETSTFKGNEALAGDTTVEVQIHAMVDKDMPGHLFRGLKRWLGISSLETINVFGVDYRVVALLTPILEHIRQKYNSNIQQKLPLIHIGRPIRFEGDEDCANRNAIKKLEEACEYAELPKPIFYPEPLGATLSYLLNSKAARDDIILAFDFGGGTLDLSIIKKTNESFEIMATHGIPIGGEKINQLVYTLKVFPEIGKDCIVKVNGLKGQTEEPFSFEKFENGLINWQHTYTLNTRKNLDFINNTLNVNRRHIDIVEQLTRLRTVINSNYSYSVINAIEKAKIDLSYKIKSQIVVEELDLYIDITRNEFETIIDSIIKEVYVSIIELLNIADIEPDNISTVIRTGGSSQIPSIIDLLERLFPGKIVEYDVFRSIAAGLSIANYYNYKFYA
jgi:hypothetical chaperone protein